MVNAWSLLDSEINGTMDEDYPIMSEKQKIPGIDVSDYAYGGLYPERFSYYKAPSFSDDPYPTIESRIPWIYESPDNGKTVYRYKQGTDPTKRELIKEEQTPEQFHYPPTDTKPEPNLKYKSQKYQEDESMKALKDYISSTYSGHYTSEQNSTQTLDLIQSVGDAESFCRSNAIKYLARYDKKGQAKRDILKAMHYCLLLYYFSGNANDETPTRGYETF